MEAAEVGNCSKLLHFWCLRVLDNTGFNPEIQIWENFGVVRGNSGRLFWSVFGLLGPFSGHLGPNLGHLGPNFVQITPLCPLTVKKVLEGYPGFGRLS